MNQVVYAAGKLWSGVNTVVRTSNGASSQTDRSGIAYFIVTPSTPSATSVAGTIAKQGYVALGNDDNAMFPSIGVNAAGKGVMTFSISGHHYYPSAAFTRIDAVNGAGDIHIAAAGTRPTDDLSGYEAFGGDGVARWGDYSAAVAAEDGTIWIGDGVDTRARSASRRSWRTGARSSATSRPSQARVASTKREGRPRAALSASRRRAERLLEAVEDQVEPDLERARLAVRSLVHVLVAMLGKTRIVVPRDRRHQPRHGLVVHRDRGVRDLPEREPEDEAVEQVVDASRSSSASNPASCSLLRRPSM